MGWFFLFRLRKEMGVEKDMEQGFPSYLCWGSLFILLVTGWGEFILDEFQITKKRVLLWYSLFLFMVSIPSIYILPKRLELSGGFVLLMVLFVWLLRKQTEEQVTVLLICSFLLGSSLFGWIEWNHTTGIDQEWSKLGTVILLVVVTNLLMSHLQEKLVLLLGGLFVWEGWTYGMYYEAITPYTIGSSYWMDVCGLAFTMSMITRWIRVKVPEWRSSRQRSS